MKREGTDLTCVSYGYALHTCLEAAARLLAATRASRSRSSTSAPSRRSTPRRSSRRCDRTSKAIVVYEDNRTYGAGAEIVATIAEEAMFDLDAPIVRIGGPDVPAMPFATPLEHYFMEPEPDQVYRRMLDLARA